jgi:hypothetical protein
MASRLIVKRYIEKLETENTKHSHMMARDLALADFIEDGMPDGRKRKGVPKDLIVAAKAKFGLKSKSAILRALSRGKNWKRLIPWFIKEGL